MKQLSIFIVHSKNFHFILLTKYMNRQQPSNISKTIQDFNRQCAEEKTKRPSYINPKYEKRIQNYSIDLASKLGEGTFSKVYQARDQAKNTQVAVKVVQLRKIRDLGIEDLFWEEINIISRLRHPNVVSCLEYFKTTNNCYTVYQYCEGGDLSKRLKKGHLGEKEDLSMANSIIKDVFQGLLYLQSMSIVHRDIKAANILLAGGKAKIGDFGFATHCKREFKDVSIGSPAYMAPEGLLNNVYGPKTDVWSFGMLLYEIVHGQTPFHDCQSESELKQRVQVPVNWDQLKGSLPSPLKRLILKCLKVNSVQRPTFKELLNDEYIQKIYKEGCLRQASKSNHTKITSDSQSSPLHSRRRIAASPFTPKQQRFVTEDEERRVSTNVKVEPKEWDGEDAGGSKGLIETINMSDLLHLVNKQADPIKVQDNQDQEVKRQEVSQQKDRCTLKEVVVEKFLILSQQSYNEEYLHNCLKIINIFKQALQLLHFIPAKFETRPFLAFSNQLLLETYWMAQKLNLNNMKAKIQYGKQFLPEFSKEVLLDIAHQRLYQRISQYFFQLIKLAETAIDRQDIQAHVSSSEIKQSQLVYIGNTIIICLQLIYNLQSHQSAEQWLSNHSMSLHSSDQFFIWLYELELKRMDRNQS